VARVLALDVGTSSVRARIYDERGAFQRGEEAQTKYEVTHGRGGQAELDADHIVEATLAALERVRQDEAVDAIAVSCFWHGLLPVGADDRPAAPLLIWQDTRSAPQAEALAQRLDPDAVHARTGAFLHPAFWPAKLAWLREERPEVFAGARRFLSFADYLQLRVRGDGRTSLSTASGTGLLNLAQGGWDAELLDALEVEPERLPEISDEPLADGDVPWFPAVGDGACSNVGAGCLDRRRAALMVGTSAALRTVLEVRTVPRPGLFLYRLDAARLVEGGAFSDGGNLWAWLGRTLRLDAAVDVAARPADGHGLTFLPLLGGERSPGWHGSARGSIAGLTFDTTPEDVLQAGLEGVALRFAEVLDRMPEVEEVVATGQALLRNRGWIQVVADVLERPVTESAVDEASARGAAVLALERLGLAPDPAPLGPTLEPRADRADAYRAARERQRRLYEATVG
jgi:gluconokinase